MAIKVGTLQVDLVANTASFTGPLDKAGQQSRKSAKDIQDGFNGMDLGAARGTLALLGEDIGITLPRHVRSFIAELPGVSEALALAFPVAAIVAAGVAIFEFTEKLQKQKEEAAKARQEMLDNIDALTKNSTATQLNNLKLQDQIAILEGRPATNKLKEALLEIKIAAIDAFKELEKVNNKAIENIEKAAVGGFKSAVTGDTDTSAQTEQAKEKLQTLTNAQKAYFEAVKSGESDPDKLRPLITNAQNAATEVNKLATAWKSATDAQVLHDSRTFQENIHNDKPDPTFLAAEEAKHQKERDSQTQLFAAAQQGQQKIADMQQQFDGTRKKGIDEQILANIEGLNKVYAASKQVTEAQTKEAIASYQVQFDTGRITAVQLEDLKQAALDKEYQAEVAHLEKVKALEAGIPILAQETNQQILALTAAHNTQILNSYAAVLDKQKGLLKEFDRAMAEEQKKATDDAVALAIKGLVKQNQAMMHSSDVARAAYEAGQEAAKQHTAALGLLAEQELKFKREMGLIGEADYEAQLKVELNATYQTAQKELQARRDATKEGTADRAKADAQLQALEDKYRQQSQAADQQALQSSINMYRQLSNTITSSFDGWIKGTDKFSQDWNKLWTGMATNAIENLVKVGAQQMLGMLLSQDIADKQQLIHAKTAATGAWAATDDIPVIGPALAPIAAAAAFAGVMAFEQGGIVPEDAYALVHHNEMVLPAPISTFIMNAASSGSSGGGAQSHFIFAPNIQAVDSEGVDRMLTKHADTFHRHITAHMRRMNFN